MTTVDIPPIDQLPKFIDKTAERAAGMYSFFRYRAERYTWTEREQRCREAIVDLLEDGFPAVEDALAMQAAKLVGDRANRGDEKRYMDGKLVPYNNEELGKSEDGEPLLDDERIEHLKQSGGPRTHYRARGHNRRLCSGPDVTRDGQPEPCRECSWGTISKEEQCAAVRTALAQLPENEQDLLELKARLTTQTAVAARWEMSQAAVSQHLARHGEAAREHFLKHYCDQLDLDPTPWLKPTEEHQAERQQRDEEYRRYLETNSANNRA